METSLNINSENRLNHSEDYDFLRKEGIKIIEQLSGKNWTDYNSHDPGITLLESLCYALTDLGYRTSFDMKDLLVNKNANNNKEFYQAHQILPCNPVTIFDFRKLIIDTEGIKNAWIEISDDYEVPMFMHKLSDNPPSFELSYEAKADGDFVQLNGLYKVFVEYDDDVINEKRESKVMKCVIDKLQFHRNLCEDFVSFAVVEYEECAIEVDIKAREGSDIEKINAEVFHLIENYFSPNIKFYSFDEMLDKGYSVDQIFEGPILKHGFILDADLQGTERYKDIFLSDIINLILNIDGVMAVNRIAIPKESTGTESSFTEWISKLKNRQKKPKLDIANSVITFVKSSDRFRADKLPDKQKVNYYYNYFQNEDKKNKLSQVKKDFELPEGTDMDIGYLYPFQKELPRLYGMDNTYFSKSDYKSENWLSKIENIEPAQKQVLQLRGFLLIFEQILANFLAQLENIGQLFSFNSNIDKTNFTQILQEINDIEALFLNLNDYIKTQNGTAEIKDTFIRRRNHFLDHIMARFGEQISTFKAVETNMEVEKLIHSKINFLNEFVQLSNYRGKAYDYTNVNEIWDSTNVEGLKKRVCRLLGIDNYERSFIATDHISISEKIHQNDIVRYQVLLKDNGETLLESIEYEFKDEAEHILNYLISNGINTKLYSQKSKKSKFGYQFLLESDDEEMETVAEKYFDSQEQMQIYYQKTIECFEKLSLQESFHIVEHILLRPKEIQRESSLKKNNNLIDTDKVSLLSVIEDTKSAVSLIDLPEIMTIHEVPPFKFKISNVAAKSHWNIALLDKDVKLIMNVDEEFIYYKEVVKRVEQIKTYASDAANYNIRQDPDGRYSFRLFSEKIVLAEGVVKYANKLELDKGIEALNHFFSNDTITKASGERENDLTSFLDPYTFNISIVIPDWPIRFQDPSYKHFLEKTIYEETPSHISANVIWVNHEQMMGFEAAYKYWIEDFAANGISNTEILNGFIYELNEIRNADINP